MRQKEEIKRLRHLVAKLFNACMIARQPLEDREKLLSRNKDFWLQRMKDASERSQKRLMECLDEFGEMYPNEIKK